MKADSTGLTTANKEQVAGDSGPSTSARLFTIISFSPLAGIQLSLGVYGLARGQRLFNSMVAFFLAGLFLFISARSAVRLRRSVRFNGRP